jgi:hypothetical protein
VIADAILGATFHIELPLQQRQAMHRPQTQ